MLDRLGAEPPWDVLFVCDREGDEPCIRAPIASHPHAIRRLYPLREELDSWLRVASLVPEARPPLAGTVQDVHDALQGRGALFFAELQRVTKLTPAFLEANLTDLVAQGRVTCDSFGALRGMLVPAWRRSGPLVGATGRWSVVPRVSDTASAAARGRSSSFLLRAARRPKLRAEAGTIGAHGGLRTGGGSPS